MLLTMTDSAASDSESDSKDARPTRGKGVCPYPKSVELESRLFILKGVDHPFTEDLLELAGLAGVPIPRRLGTMIIHMLDENVAPIGIRTVLHRILQNCQTKRIPQRKLQLHDPANEAGSEYKCKEAAANDGDVRYRHQAVTEAGCSMATRYLIENSRISIRPADPDESDADDKAS